AYKLSNISEAQRLWEVVISSLDDWDSSYARCATRLKIVNERRTRAAEKEMSQMKEGEELAEKKKASRAEKKATKKQEKKAEKKDKAQIMKRKAGMEGSQNQQIDKFPTSLDKHTLFVSNLPFDAKESEIEELFSKHGVVKQVRLVTNRAGKPKGYGYVEYEQEVSAFLNAMQSLYAFIPW
ncbi:predicted protein, partial [Nematostella vectensis]